ncbi:MAG: pyridoxal phosphate-dependent aminotransferase family protein [Bdellovibrionaceae bacterium]|nr:pyridoxal phosphate-dependent aminotransferase family protein [Pseudobdellovibrionaceae bacterium]
MSKFEQLKKLDESRLYNLPIEAVNGRELSSRGRKLLDFVNTNYLGFEFDLAHSIRAEEYQRQWGSLCGWSRMEIDADIYPTLEKRVSEFLGAKETLLSHTITLTNFSLIPGIVGKGTLFCDEIVHAVVFEACRLARDHGAQLKRFKHQNWEDLEAQLKDPSLPSPKLICVDGVYSVSSEIADIRRLHELCRKYDAYLYVDDAHGFGVLGENPTVENPYGTGGTGVVRHFGENFERIFYVTSFGKAFSSHTAFAAIPDAYQENYRSFCTQYLFSAGMSPRTIGEVHDVLDFNASEGEFRRAKLRGLVRRFVQGIQSLGFACWNVKEQPVIYVPVGDLDTFMKAAAFMDRAGIIAGLRAYPLVGKNECGFRFAVTALHETRHIDQALTALADLRHMMGPHLLERSA